MAAPELRIGPLTLASPVLLAPMAGFTNAAMRRVCRRFGAALAFTEMTNGAGLVRASDKTWQLLETFDDEGPVVAHLYGSEPAVMAAAAAAVAATGRFCGIDLNAGCPVRKITCNGCGAALMKEPARIGRIVAAMKAASGLPVTVKTRVGLHPGQVSVFEVLDAVEQVGGAAIAIHGRFASDGHTGPVRHDLLAAVRQAARIPVIGNGGVNGGRDAVALMRATGVDGVMVGRAAMGNPWVFGDILRHLEGAEGAPPRIKLPELRDVLFEHIGYEIELLRRIEGRYEVPRHAMTPEAAAVVGFRCHFFRYLSGLKGASHARSQLARLHTLEDVRVVVDACLEREAAYRAKAPGGI